MSNGETQTEIKRPEGESQGASPEGEGKQEKGSRERPSEEEVI